MNYKSTATLLTLLGTSSLLAQKEANIPTTTTPEKPSGLSGLFAVPELDFFETASASVSSVPLAQLSYNHQFSSDFDSIAGDFSSDEISLITPLASIQVGEAYVIPALMYRWSDFDSSAPSLLPDDSVHQIRLPIAAIYEPKDRWIVGGMVMPTLSGDWNSNDSFSISAGLAAGYKVSDNFSLFGGVYYVNGHNDSYAIPGINFIWKPIDNLQVYFLGPLGSISYDLNEDWAIALTFEYDSPTWYVESDDNGPDRNVNLSSFRVGFRTDRRLGRFGWGYATVGYSFLRNLEVEDMDSRTLQDEDIDSGLFVETGISLRF